MAGRAQTGSMSHESPRLAKLRFAYVMKEPTSESALRLVLAACPAAAASTSIVVPVNNGGKYLGTWYMVMPVTSTHFMGEHVL